MQSQIEVAAKPEAEIPAVGQPENIAALQSEKVYQHDHNGRLYEGTLDDARRVCPALARMSIKEVAKTLAEADLAERLAAKGREKRLAKEAAQLQEKAKESATPEVTVRVSEQAAKQALHEPATVDVAKRLPVPEDLANPVTQPGLRADHPALADRFIHEHPVEQIDDRPQVKPAEPVRRHRVMPAKKAFTARRHDRLATHESALQISPPDRRIVMPQAVLEQEPASNIASSHSPVAEEEPSLRTDERHINPLEVYKDFSEALRTFVLPSSELPMAVTDNSPQNHETQPVPPIAKTVTERLAELEPEEVESIAPLVQNIAAAISELQQIDAENEIPAVVAAKARFEVLVMELFEALAIKNYDEEDVRQFVRLILHPDFYAVETSRKAASADLAHGGTHEAKLFLSQVASSLAGVEDELRQLLGRFVLVCTSRAQLVV